MGLLGDPRAASIFAAQAMNDYRLIQNSKTFRRLLPGDTASWHSRSVRKLDEFFGGGDPMGSVVVTHHAPSIRSVAERYRMGPVTPAFASNMEHLITKHQPLLWVHGHTHISSEYCIGKTRIVCNPRGYASIEENSGFRPDFVAEI